MLALEHLHANALLVVLLGGALAIVSLRAAVYLLHRSLVAADRKIMSRVTSLARPTARFDLRSQAHTADGSALLANSLAQPGTQADKLSEMHQDTEQRSDSKT